MESVYNDIFGLRVRRGLVQRVVMFYSAVTLGPFLIAAGFVMSAQLGEVSGFVSWVTAALVPLAFTATALVIAIRALPCTVVRWRAAFVGGLVSAVVFELAKWAFQAYTLLFGTRNTMTVLYGSLGFLPVFLLWLYVVWIVVLMGVEVAYLVEHWDTLIDAQRRRAVDPHAQRRQPDGLFALAVMSAVVDRYVAGRGPSSIEGLADALSTDPHHVQLVLDVLVDADLLAETEAHDVLPSRPPDSIGAAEVLAAWRELAVPAIQPTKEAAALVDAGLGALETALDRPVAARGET
jgi:hypothetical protein